jgi:hypothetical protein
MLLDKLLSLDNISPENMLSERYIVHHTFQNILENNTKNLKKNIKKRTENLDAIPVNNTSSY